MLYFFLSYARGDEDALVQRFYEDLSTDVRLIAGLSSNEAVGFVDRTILVGQRWPARLTEALANCRSFLALMTPRYFQSEACGKEWQLFADRTAQFEAQHRVDTSLLKPLMWIPAQAGRMHQIARPIQYSSGSLGDLYHRLGVRQLMRLQRHRDDYRSFVFELATQIVDSVETHPLPESRRGQDFSTVASAFHTAAPGPALPAELVNGVRVRATPMLVQFVIAASSRYEMGAVRQDLTAYGEEALEWAPYRPPLADPLVELARGIAADHSYESEVVDLRGLADLADLAHQANQIVVLIVDAWVTRLREPQQALIAHTGAAARNTRATTAVLIPSSRDDPETREHWQTLSRACREIFDELAHDDELYRSNIMTHRAFEEDLPEVLEVARNRVYSRGRVRRPPASSVSTEAPQIDGPWVIDPGME